MTPQTEIITVNQVTELYGLSRSTVYAWVSKKAIPYFKPSPKMLLFLKPDIEKFLLTNRYAPQSEIDEQATTTLLTKRGTK